MLEINNTYLVRIEETNIFANGVCHINDMVVFVENALAGELCLVKITKVLSKYAYARCIEIVEQSSARITSDCPYFPKCGGCTFPHVSIEEENRIKHNYVKNMFTRNKLNAKVEQTVCMEYEEYRNKVVLFYDGEAFGYMERGTNRIIPHQACNLNDGVFDKIADFVAENLKSISLRALYMRKSSGKKSEVMVCIILKKEENIDSFIAMLVKEFPSVKSVSLGINSDKSLVLERIKFKTIYGDGVIFDEICGLRFRVSPESFFQINHSCTEKLYEKAIELAGVDENSICADLFCGVGTIGIISAKQTGAKIYGVEIVEKAIQDARTNAVINGIENIYLEAMDAKNFEQHVDVCIIDPPRKGCSELMIKTLKRLLPERIVYISCNVETMTRDILLLNEKYEISSPVSVFNMFPRTSHVESVVCLKRSHK